MDHPSRLFVGYRALGFTTNGIPLGIRYNRKRRENYVVTCVGRALHTYNCSKLGIHNVSNRLPEAINCLAIDRTFDYVGCGKDVYALAKGKRVKFIYHGHTSDVHLLLPFADHLISVDKSSVVKIWNIRQDVEYSEMRHFDNETFEITSLVHPEGLPNLVLFGSRQGRLQLWNINTDKLLYTFVGWDSPVLVLEQSPECKVIAIGLADGRIIVHNIEFDQTVMAFKQEWGEVTAISFRTDGQCVMCTGSAIGHIALWDLEKRQLQSQILSAHNHAAVTGLHCLPGEPLMVTSSPNNSLKVWIFDQPDHGGRLLRQRSGHSKPPTKIRFHGNDGQAILSAGLDSTLQLFSTVHDKFNKSLGRASYNKEKTKKAGLLHDKHRMAPIMEFVSETARQSDWDGILACHRGDPTATTWNFLRSTMGKHKLQSERANDPNVVSAALCVDITACGNFGIVGFSSGYVDVFNMQSGRHCPNYGCGKQAHDGHVVGVCVDGYNQILVTAGTDGDLNFWKFQSKHFISRTKLDAPASKLLMHRDSCMLAAALDNFHVAVIDIETQVIVRQFTGHLNSITDMAFSADGRWLITASLDCTIKTWDLPSGKLIDCFLVEHPVTSLTFSPTGLFLATTHVSDIGVYLWSNMTLFGASVTLTPLPADYEPTTMDLPSTSVSTKGERNHSEDEQLMVTSVDYEPIEQISPDMVTFSQLPQSRWKNLLNLDVIRQRNKPKQPPTKPKSAPFFLPTVAGLEPKFKIPDEGTKQTDDGSRISSLISTKILSDFGRLLDKSRTDKDYGAVRETLKSMGPSAIELELSLLVPDVDGGSMDLMVDFIDFLVHLFDTNLDTDLASSYLGLFLKLHGETLSSSEVLQPQLSRLERSQTAACERLSRQTDRIMCITEYLRGAVL